MAETTISAQKSLYELIKRVHSRFLLENRTFTIILKDSLEVSNLDILQYLAYPDGAVHMAAKKYYFGVGGGTRQYLSMIEKDGFLASTLVSEVTDGSSNVREVWELSYK